MNKIMSRYKGLFLSFMSVMLIVVCVCSFSFESSASTNTTNDFGREFYLSYPEPATSDYEGWLNLLLYDVGRDTYRVVTFFWYCCASKDSVESPCAMWVYINEDNVQFVPAGVQSVDVGFYNLTYIDFKGDYDFMKWSSSERFTANFENWWNSTVQIMGAKWSGNIVINLDTTVDTNYTVYFTEDGTSQLLMDVLSKLTQINTQTVLNTNTIHTVVLDILNSVDGVENQLSKIVDYIKSIDDELHVIDDDLKSLLDKADELLEEEKKQTSWLEKIWNSIQKFFSPDEEDKSESDKLKDESDSKSEQIESATEESKTDKIDVEDASGTVDGYIDDNAVSNYSKVLSVFTNNGYIVQYILIVLAVAFVSYILFGKR